MEISLSKILNEVVEDMTKQGVLHEGGLAVDPQTGYSIDGTNHGGDGNDLPLEAQGNPQLMSKMLNADQALNKVNDLEAQLRVAKAAHAAAEQQADWVRGAPQIRSASEDSATIAADDARRYAQSIPGKVGAWWDGLSTNQKLLAAGGGGALGGAMAAGLGAVALRKKLRSTQG